MFILLFGWYFRVSVGLGGAFGRLSVQGCLSCCSGGIFGCQLVWVVLLAGFPFRDVYLVVRVVFSGVSWFGWCFWQAFRSGMFILLFGWYFRVSVGLGGAFGRLS